MTTKPRTDGPPGRTPKSVTIEARPTREAMLSPCSFVDLARVTIADANVLTVTLFCAPRDIDALMESIPADSPPATDDGNAVLRVELEPVAKLVITHEFARQLVKLLESAVGPAPTPARAGGGDAAR